MAATKLVRRAGSRLRWEVYRGQLLLRWRAWDKALARPRAQARIRAAQIHSTTTPSALADDPLQLQFGPPRAPSEYAYHLEPGAGAPAWLEPENGYVFSNDGVLFEHTLSWEQTSARLYSEMASFCGVPATSLAGRVSAGAIRPEVSLEHALSMRFVYERNYYHLLFDGLTKLAMFARLGMPASTPIIVGEELMDMPYARSIFSRGALAKREWVVQPRQAWVRAEDLWAGQVNPENLEYVEALLDLMDAKPDVAGQRRIFVTRRIDRGRAITNMDEIAPVLKKHRIEVVDADDMPHEEQIALFASARLVVGIHGAGLANIIFRRGLPTTVIEIHPPEKPMRLTYRRIARGYGYDYSYLIAAYDRRGRGPYPFPNLRVKAEQLAEVLDSVS